jgi:hypothetical protein
MKINILKQICIFLAAGFILISQNINAQSEKLTRKEKKELRKAQLEVNFNILDSLLNSRTFVLKADYLRNRSGDLTPVTSNLNFIKVDRGEGVLQTGSNSGLGYNGVGGVTAEGGIGIWELSKDSKQLTFTLHFTMLTNIGNYDILIYIRADNNASATIKGLGSGSLTMQGELYTVGNARIFKGTETF